MSNGMKADGQPGSSARADDAALSPADLEALAGARDLFAGLPTPDVTAHVMRRVMAQPAPVPAGGWVTRVMLALWTPRPMTMRPLYAGLAVACVVLLMAQAYVPFRADATETARVQVQFRLNVEASSVQLAGTFTNWEPAYALHEVAPGLWTVTVSLPEGVHDYAFVVDGREWKTDPYAFSIDDGFGATASRLAVLGPGARIL